MFVFYSSRRRHTRCALVTGVQTCALPIYCALPEHLRNDQPATSMGAAPCRHRVHWERAQSLVGCAARFQSAESMSTETRRRDGEAAGDRRKGRGGNPPMAESGSPWQTHRTFLKYRAKQKRTALIRHCRWHKIGRAHV